MGYNIVNKQNLLRIDENIFDNIDSEEKAYWLGFIFADGCIYISRRHNKLSYRFYMGLKESDYEIFSIDTNIRYGCYYLRYLIDKFKVEKTALSAYNAGEGNVLSWLKNNKYSIDGKSLNTIPFKETEEYIKKVYKSYDKYRKLYGNIVDKTKNFE